MAPRFGGSINDIAAIIAEHAATPDFLKYGDKMHKTPIDPKLLLPHKTLFKKLSGLHPRLTWTKADFIFPP